MAFKLTKAEQQAKQGHIEALQTMERDLAIATNSYNEAVRAAAEWVQEATAKWRREYDAKSERWQTGWTNEKASSRMNSRCPIHSPPTN